MNPETEISNEPSWGYTDLLLFVFLGTLSVLIGQLAVQGAAMLLHFDAKDRALTLMPGQMVLYGLLFLVLYMIIKLQYGRSFWRSLAWVNSGIAPGAAVFAGVFLAFAIGSASLLLHMPDVDTPVKHLLTRRSTAIQFGIVGTTIGPLVEELVFRGFMQPVLVRSVGRVIGILLTAMVFGVLHLAQNAFTWQSGVLIAVAGIAFGWMRELTGSTRASTLMHSAYNLTFFMALLTKR